MGIYEFGCRQCGITRTSPDKDTPPGCPVCGFAMRRVFSVTISKGVPAHFNVATGTHVRNERHMNDEFKRLSDEASERLGFEQHYAPVDINDKKALGVTDEGLAETHDAHVAEGIIEPTRKLY